MKKNFVFNKKENTGDIDNTIGMLYNTTNITTGTTTAANDIKYTDINLSIDESIYTNERKALKDLFKEFAMWAKENNRKIEFSDFDKFIEDIDGVFK